MTHRPNEALARRRCRTRDQSELRAVARRTASPPKLLGRFEQAKSDVQQAMRLSPRDPLAIVHMIWAMRNSGSDISTPQSRNSTRRSTRAGRAFFLTNLAAAYALEGKMDEAKSALAEARRLIPKLTVKWMKRACAELSRPCSRACARRGCRRSERDPQNRGDPSLGHGRQPAGSRERQERMAFAHVSIHAVIALCDCADALVPLDL